MHSAKPKSGIVYLVGAGPGDPGLITVRGVQCLQQADAVLYDYLANPRLLAHAPLGAERICLGRHGQGRIMSQTEVHERMVGLARQGKRVVRLKAGDPLVFARAAEELEALAAAGVAVEIVPGITVALAAASYAQIPITDRDLASAVTLVTGQEHAEKQESALDYSALARLPGTLVFYMAVTTAAEWTAALIAAGKSDDTPAAIIRRCTWPDQIIVRCTLGEVSRRIAAEHLRPPVIVVLGDVVRRMPDLSWFAARPLFGRRIVVTRPAGQAEPLVEKLEALGAQCLLQPAIVIGPPADWSPVHTAIARLDQFDWLVFSSANGVRYFLDRICETGDLRRLGQIRLAAIGPGTTQQLADYHLRADLQPPEFRAEALASELAAELNRAARGRRCLLVRASRGREVLAEQLAAAGATVEQVVAYQSTDVTEPDAEVRELLAAGKIDWITVTSSAIARSLAALFGDDLRHARLASISPITSATLRELSLEPAVEATSYTLDGVVAAILHGDISPTREF